MKPLFDTNILIDYLHSIPQALHEFRRYDTRSISVTWIEVMVGGQPQTERATRDFLGTFETYPVDELIADEAVGLRRDHRIRLPDAVVWGDGTDPLIASRDAKHQGLPDR